MYRLIYNALPLLLPPLRELVVYSNDAEPKSAQENTLFRDLELARAGSAKFAWANLRTRGSFSLVAGVISAGVAIRSVDAGLRSEIAQQAFVRFVHSTRSPAETV